MRAILVVVILVSCTPSLVKAQLKTPADFLSAIPSPPKSAADAIRRCPNDADTVAMRWLRDLQLQEQKQQSSIERDSIKFGDRKRLPPVLPKEMSEYRSLQQEVDGQRDSLVARMQRLTSRPSERLLNAIRIVGEELDGEIKNCPKVGSNLIHDSVCVANAEARSEKKRIAACNDFLLTINQGWNAALEPLHQSFPSREKRIWKLLATTKHYRLALQLKRLRLETWQTVAPILKTIDDVTRLAAQFSRE